MDALKVQVKDVANFFNNLGHLDYRVLADFTVKMVFTSGALTGIVLVTCLYRMKCVQFGETI